MRALLRVTFRRGDPRAALPLDASSLLQRLFWVFELRSFSLRASGQAELV